MLVLHHFDHIPFTPPTHSMHIPNLYVSKLLKVNSPNTKEKWKIVGIDPDGFDLRKKDKLIRYCFERSIDNASKLRGVFVKLHKQASIS